MTVVDSLMSYISGGTTNTKARGLAPLEKRNLMGRSVAARPESSESQRAAWHKIAMTAGRMFEALIDPEFKSDGGVVAEKFESNIPCSLPISQYTKRFALLEFEKDIYVTALILIDRFEKQSEILCNQFNTHRIVLASLVIAMKLVEDTVWKNTQFVQVGGVFLHEVNRLEVTFLTSIKWNLFVSPAEFREYEKIMDSFELE
jgi:hypothetical protein